MSGYKAEMIAYFIQIIVLIIFYFILNDILAALIVSLLSHPLVKIAINSLIRNSK